MFSGVCLWIIFLNSSSIVWTLGWLNVVEFLAPSPHSEGFCYFCITCSLEFSWLFSVVHSNILKVSQLNLCARNPTVLFNLMIWKSICIVWQVGYGVEFSDPPPMNVKGRRRPNYIQMYIYPPLLHTSCTPAGMCVSVGGGSLNTTQAIERLLN